MVSICLRPKQLQLSYESLVKTINLNGDGCN